MSGRLALRGGVVGGDQAIQLVTHLSEGGHARLDALVPPPEPRRGGHVGSGEYVRHDNSVLGGIRFDGDDFGGDLLHDAENVQECTVSQCRNARSLTSAHVHNQAVTDIAAEARAFLTQALEKSGLKPHALAKRAGVAATTITRPLNDAAFKFTPKPATLRKIAEASGMELPVGLATASSGPPTTQELPILGNIQAGAWLEIDDTSQVEPVFFTAVADRRYPHAPQWLREVRGDSMNERGIVRGDLAHLVDLTAAGINLNSGMVVEVTRIRNGGGEREITLKEVEITDAGISLWPRSTNPRWKDPIVLDDGQSGDIEVRITGLLLQAIKRFI